MFKRAVTTLTLTLATGIAAAQPGVRYEVTITNVTPGQSFTPQLVVTHPASAILFRLGEPASEPL